jgi:hypothetical protein
VTVSVRELRRTGWSTTEYFMRLPSVVSTQRPRLRLRLSMRRWSPDNLRRPLCCDVESLFLTGVYQRMVVSSCADWDDSPALSGANSAHCAVSILQCSRLINALMSSTQLNGFQRLDVACKSLPTSDLLAALGRCVLSAVTRPNRGDLCLPSCTTLCAYSRCLHI